MVKKLYYGGRYSIKYHPETKNMSFYLSGATQENRQETYRALADLLTSFKEIGAAGFDINQGIFQDIKSDIILTPGSNYELTVSGTDMGNILGSNLGLIPKDHRVNELIAAYYALVPDNLKAQVFRINNIKFNAWNGSTILIGIICNMNLIEGYDVLRDMPQPKVTHEDKTEVPEEIKTETAEGTGSEERRCLPAPAISNPVVSKPVYTNPIVLEEFQTTSSIVCDSLDDITKYVLAQFESMAFILSNIRAPEYTEEPVTIT